MLNLITFNRWWDTGQVEPAYFHPYKRHLFYQLIKFLDNRQILLIYGLRRVGKTTLIYQLIDLLLKKGADKKTVLYFSFDDKSASLEELLKNYTDLVLTQDIFKEKKIYIFLDEIQKLPDWQNQLKIFYDLYPNVKFIVSGSASLAILQGAKESLAGRIYEFILPLLSFREFLNLHGEKIQPVPNVFDLSELKNIYLKKERVAPLFFSYLKKGGFIEIAKEENDLKIKEYGKSILERTVFGDIPLIFKIKKPQILQSLLELTGSNPGFLLDYSKLAETFNYDQRLLADYVFYLKYAFLIKVLYNFSGSQFASERKLKKIYLTSTNFIYQTQPDKFADPVFLGKIIENLTATFAPSQFFWRRRQDEVDLILPGNIPLEIKYKEKIIKADLKGLFKFSQKFKTKQAILLTKDELSHQKINQVDLYSMPVWLFLASQ